MRRLCNYKFVDGEECGKPAVDSVAWKVGDSVKLEWLCAEHWDEHCNLIDTLIAMLKEKPFYA